MATLNREDFMTDERLEMVFNIIDKVKNIILYIILNKKYTQDKTGKISFESVKKLFQECDKNVPSEFWKKLLEEFSRYENGYVIFCCFCLYNIMFNNKKLDLFNFKLFMKQSIRRASATRQ